MASDQVEILGRWLVSFKTWKWEYVFQADGRVTWRDPHNGDSGAGRWSLTAATVYITWAKSTTVDVWNRPIRREGQTGSIEASYGKGAFTAQRMYETVLPSVAGGSEVLEMEMDPATGRYVAGRPTTHPKYVDRVFSAVAYGIADTAGYLVYCDTAELPVLVPEKMVDFGLANAQDESGTIHDGYAAARAAAFDSPGQRRVAYFWGAGGAVVSPTVIGPATTPELYSTIIAVRSLRDLWVSVMLPAITVAIGMIGGPQPVSVKNGKGTARLAKRRGGNVPSQQAQAPKVVAAPARPRAARAQLQEIVSNPMDHLTFRTRDPAVASSQALTFTGETSATAPEGIYATRGIGNAGYGPYAVTVKASKVSVRPVAGRADEFVIVSPIEAGDGIWWHASELAGIRK